jgi:hypothetical protein
MSGRESFFLGVTLSLVSFLFIEAKGNASYNLPDPYEWISQDIKVDTIPLKDRYGNWIEDPNTNPFDLLDPEEVIKKWSMIPSPIHTS